MPKHQGFTLIELLVVVAIISILVSMLLPSLGKAKDSAKAIACSANLHSIALTHAMWINDHAGYMICSSIPTIYESGNFGPGAYGAGYTWTEAWVRWNYLSSISYSDSSQNANGTVLDCPSYQADDVTYRYSPCYGWNYGFLGDYNGSTGIYTFRKADDVSRPSATLAFADSGGPDRINSTAIHWDYLVVPYLTPQYRHSGKANFAWVDGHVEGKSFAQIYDSSARYWEMYK